MPELTPVKMIEPEPQPAPKAEAPPEQPIPSPAPQPDDKKPTGAFSKLAILGATTVVVVLAVFLIPTLTRSAHKPKLTATQKEKLQTAESAKDGAVQNQLHDRHQELNAIVSDSGHARSTYPDLSTDPKSTTLAAQEYSPINRDGPSKPPPTNRTLSAVEQLDQTRANKEIESLNSSPLVYTRAASVPATAQPSTLQPATTAAHQASYGPPSQIAPFQPSAPPSSSAPPNAAPRPAQNGSPNSPQSLAQNARNLSIGPGRKLFEGTYIDTVLTTRINGTFAGPVNCMVTTNVWSHNRQQILIPQGAQVLGEAHRVDVTGQERLAVVFHRIIMPDGFSVSLDQFTGLNQIGETGLKDKVDNHYLRIFGTSLALGAIAGLSSMSSSSSGNSNSGGNFSQGFSQTISQEAMQILNKYLNILPTVIIREGVRVKVYLTSDLTVPAYDDHRMPNGI